MKLETIVFNRAHDAGWITLNRPGALNATSDRMFSELLHVFEEVRCDETLKALVITGAGDKAFCIGSDINFLDEAFDTRDFSQFRDYLERINHVLFMLEELPLPTVAMVQGKARAGGFELLLACDFVIIAEEAHIGDVHTPYGHMPGAGATQRLPRKIGVQRALEIIMTGRWLSASEAVELGLALKAVPRAHLLAATTSFVNQLSDKTRDSLKYIKRAVLHGWDLPLRDGVRFEAQSYIEYLATCMEPVEIYKDNLAKRKKRQAQTDATGAQGAAPERP